MKLRIFNYSYFNIFENEHDKSLECPILVITGRDKDSVFHTLKIPGNHGIFRPHMYVEDTPENRILLDELMIDDKILEWGEWPYPSVYDKNERVLILYCQFPFEVKRVRSMFLHTYEADVKYENMFMMKLKLEGGFLRCPNDGWVEAEDVKPLPEEEHFIIHARIFYFDIETDLLNKEEKFTYNNSLVISLVIYDNYSNEYHYLEWSKNNNTYWVEERNVRREFKHEDIPEFSKGIFHHCKDEKELLEHFFHLFNRQPDGLFTFNGHGGYKLVSVKSESKRIWRNGYDEPVIYLRAKALGLEKELQAMSPLPRFKNKYGHYYGVYHRGREEKFEVVIRGLTPLDFYIAAPSMQYTEKYRDFFGESLENYLQYFAKQGKISHEGLSVAELKEINLEKELRYNKIDVEGMVFLNNFFGFSNDIFDTVSLSMVNGIDVLSSTKIHKFITLYESQDYCVYDTTFQGWSRNTWMGWINGRTGGYVADIKRGIGGPTVVIDASQFYSNIARAANAGIDTLIQVAQEYDDCYIDTKGVRFDKKDCVITPSAPFRTDFESVEKKIWDKLIAHRSKYKKKLAEVYERTGKDTNHPLYKLYWSKQYNLKQRLVNNKYGANGNPVFLNYCLPVYNHMPSTAQEIIKGLEYEFIPSIGYSLRGGDTDSIFVALKSDNLKQWIAEADNLVSKANIFIDKFVKEKFNMKKHNIRVGWEVIAPKFYGHMKKNYAMPVWALDGKILEPDKRYIMYKGFELKKGNRADITEIVQKTYLDIAFDSDVEKEFMDRIAAFVKRADEIFEFLPWHTVCARGNLRKKLSEYQENFFLRRAAETTAKYIGSVYGLGSSGYLAWIKGNGNNKLKTLMLFKPEDEKKIKQAELKLDYNQHKKKYMIDKLNLLLSDYKTNFHSILRAGKIKSIMVL